MAPSEGLDPKKWKLMSGVETVSCLGGNFEVTELDMASAAGDLAGSIELTVLS